MYLGIDIGTGSVKCALLGADGSVETLGASYGKEKSREERVGFQSPDTLVATLRQLLSRVGAMLRETREPLWGISASGHGPSMVVLDASGRPLGDLLTWQESSARDEAAELRELYPGFSKTGECWEAKLLRAWRKRGMNHPGSCALFPKDYLNFLLTGRKVMDHSTASTLAFYRRADGDGSWKLPEEIETSFVPEIVESYGVAGLTCTSFASDCGIPPGVPVFGGGIDAWCEALGAGAVEPGDLVDGSGTSTCVSSCCAAGDTPLDHVIPGRSFRIETISSTGKSIRWAQSLFDLAVDEWKRWWETEQQTGRGENGTEPRPLPLLFLPYLTGERSPVWNEDASALFLGMRSGDEKHHLMEAVHQGTAMAIGQCLRIIAPDETGDGPGSPVRAVGGGAENAPWLRMKADLSGRTFLMMRQKDAAPVGAGVLAALGTGAGTVEELSRRWNRVEQEIPPRRESRERWNRLYDLYQGTYQLVEKHMNSLAELRRNA